MSFTPLVPPSSAGTSLAQALGLAMWTMDPDLPVLSAGGNPAANGNLLLGLATPVKSQTINKLGANLVVAGVTAGLGVNRLAIFTQAGVLLQQTVDATAAFGGTGYVEVALAAGVPVVAGTPYYLGILTSFTGTVPTLTGLAGSVNLPENIRGAYPNIFFTGQTTVPASFTPSAGSSNSGSYFLTAGP